MNWYISPLKDSHLISNPNIKISYKSYPHSARNLAVKLNFKFKNADYELKISKPHFKLYYCDYLVEDEVIVYYFSSGRPKVYTTCFYNYNHMLLELPDRRIVHNAKNSTIYTKDKTHIFIISQINTKNLNITYWIYDHPGLDFYNSKQYYLFKDERYYYHSWSLYFLANLFSNINLNIEELFENYVDLENNKETEKVKVHFSDQVKEVPIFSLKQLASDFIDNQLDNPEQDVYILDFKAEDLSGEDVSFELLSYLQTRNLSSYKKRSILKSLEK